MHQLLKYLFLICMNNVLFTSITFLCKGIAFFDNNMGHGPCYFVISTKCEIVAYCYTLKSPSNFCMYDLLIGACGSVPISATVCMQQLLLLQKMSTHHHFCFDFFFSMHPRLKFYFCKCFFVSIYSFEGALWMQQL